jgi:hypothetical protein
VTGTQYRELQTWLVIKTRKRVSPWKLGISADNRLLVETEEFGLRRDREIMDLPWSATVDQLKSLIAPKLRETSPCRPTSPAAAIAAACDDRNL